MLLAGFVTLQGAQAAGLHPVGHIQPTLDQLMKNCNLWEGLNTRGVHGGLSLVGGTPHQSRGRLRSPHLRNKEPQKQPVVN